MDFAICNFEQLEEEWAKNEKIMWEVEMSENKNGLYSKLKTGDIVYFYVCNFPSSIGVKESRILLRGEVFDEPHPVQYKDVYWRSEETYMIGGFSIRNLTALEKENLENDNYLSLSYLRNIDPEFINPQGKRRWPNQDDGNLSEEIIKELEGSFTQIVNKNAFKSLISHFS